MANKPVKFNYYKSLQKFNNDSSNITDGTLSFVEGQNGALNDVYLGEDKWNNLKIGGRNLFRTEYFIGDLSSKYKIPFDALQPREGDNTYVLSLDYKISSEDKASSPRITCFYTGDGDNRIFWDVNVVRDGEWHHKEYTMQLDTDESRYPINGGFTDYGSAEGRTIDMVSVRNIKIERGTITTDWTPAPEDVDDKISTVNNSLTALASTLLDPDEGEIPKLTSEIATSQQQAIDEAVMQAEEMDKKIKEEAINRVLPIRENVWADKSIWDEFCIIDMSRLFSSNNNFEYGSIERTDADNFTSSVTISTSRDDGFISTYNRNNSKSKYNMITSFYLENLGDIELITEYPMRGTVIPSKSRVYLSSFGTYSRAGVISFINSLPKGYSVRISNYKVEIPKDGEVLKPSAYVPCIIHSPSAVVGTDEFKNALNTSIKDNVKVGGRNLIRSGYFNKLRFDSDTPESLTIDHTEMKITIVAKDKWNLRSWLNNLSAYTTIDLEKELGEYTLSFSVRGRGTFEFGVNADSNNESISKVFRTITEDWQRVSISFKRTIEVRSLFFIQSPNRDYGVVDDWVQFTDDWKLERGTIATDWTPAPEDLITEIDTNYQKKSDVEHLYIKGPNITNTRLFGDAQKDVILEGTSSIKITPSNGNKTDTKSIATFETVQGLLSLERTNDNISLNGSSLTGSISTVDIGDKADKSYVNRYCRIADTRNDDNPPAYYRVASTAYSVIREFKASSTIGLDTLTQPKSNHVYLNTINGYTDASGGPVIQYAWDNRANLWIRKSDRVRPETDEKWGPWSCSTKDLQALIEKCATKEDLKKLDINLFEVVATLPSTGTKNKIYLVPSSTGADQNIYKEYVYLTDKSKWEQLGEIAATVDLSGYTKTKDLPSAITNTVKGSTELQGLLKGEKGDTGLTGTKGDTGDKGADGHSPVVEVKADNYIYVDGVQQQYLKGDKGDQGPQGIQGEKGDKGDTGPKGSDANTLKIFTRFPSGTYTDIMEWAHAPNSDVQQTEWTYPANNGGLIIEPTNWGGRSIQISTFGPKISIDTVQGLLSLELSNKKLLLKGAHINQQDSDVAKRGIINEIDLSSIAGPTYKAGAGIGISSENTINVLAAYRSKWESSGVTLYPYSDTSDKIIKTSGQFQAAKGFFETSDARLKLVKSKLDTDKSISFIENVDSINYTLKADKSEKNHIGFIAQDVEEYYPELIDVDEKGYKSINYAKLSAALFPAVKELLKEVKELKEELKALKK